MSDDDEAGRARERATVAAAKAGDRQALDRLLRQHQPQVYAVCRRLCGNDADALDATQEALVSMVRGLARFDGRSKVSTWAYRIATNASLDELRRRSRRPVVGIDGTPVGKTEPADERTPDPATSVTDADEVTRALDQLPVEFRAAVVLRDLCQLGYREIAEVLEVPPGTVRSRIARGRAQLAAHLGGNQTDAPERPRSTS